MSRKRRNKRSSKELKQLLSLIIVICLIIVSYFSNNLPNQTAEYTNITYTYANIDNIPEYTGEIYVTLNNNIPQFKESDYTTESFEKYSELDKLGRCGVAFANICKEIMPIKERESISDVEPTGWQQAKYDGEYLYNRCHLIGHQLAGEDANELNLITGTKDFNVVGMLQFENKVANYIKQNEENHVLYRVTPIFKENNLVASGVQMEAYSVEDNGSGVCFNVYVYNVQPGIHIEYATGKSGKK